jgi:heat shock protein HslJ
VKTRTLTILVVVLAVLLVLALVFVFRQMNTSSPPASTPVPTPMPITDILWEWTGMQDSSGEMAVSRPNDYTIVFNTDGTVAIQADCNEVAGTYSLSGSSLNIQLGASTQAFCGEDSEDQLYLASLGKVSSYASDQSGLELQFSDGKMDFRDGGPAR